MTTISNSSPLISLSTIGQLDLLQSLYGTIHIPQAVYHEVVTQGAGKPGSKEVASATWIKRHTVKNRRAIRALLTTTKLKAGESEAIILAKELQATTLILDERPARRVALSQHLPVIGSGGLLLLAKDQQLIPEVKPLLDALVAAGLRIHPQLYQAILRSAGE